MDAGSLDFATTEPRIQLYFLLGLVYAAVTPVLLPFIVVFFAFSYVVFRHQGVQPLLDGVLSYLPCPTEVRNYALDQTKNEEKVALSGTPVGPLVALAFKLEEGRFGQLTYLRIYEGVLKKGVFFVNVNTGKRIKVPRLVWMHSNEMEDIQEAHAGQILAMFGIDCASGQHKEDVHHIS